MSALLPAVTSFLALLFALMLVDQWRERRHGYQLVWAFGMLWYGIGSGCEALAAAGGWNEVLYRTWYLTGAVWTASWLGLGTAFLLGRTRFGYTYAFLLLFSGLLALMIRNSPNYAWRRAAAGAVPDRDGDPRPRHRGRDVLPERPLAALRGRGRDRGDPPVGRAHGRDASLPPPGYAVSPTTGQPIGDAMPGYLRLLTPIMNITGAGSLVLGALFSTYVFIPKRRVLGYSLDPNQPGDQFLFNLFIAPVAILVNLVASLPGAVRALFAGRLHSRVPATILIAIGGLLPTITDSMARAGSTEAAEWGKFLGVVFLFAGFLVSTEVFREVRIPFTSIRFATRRRARRAARDAQVEDGNRTVEAPESEVRRCAFGQPPARAAATYRRKKPSMAARSSGDMPCKAASTASPRQR